MKATREPKPRSQPLSRTRRPPARAMARCELLAIGSIRRSGWSAARAILVGYSGILFAPLKTGAFPYCGLSPAKGFSSGENRWASRSHICPSIIRRELARTIRLTSFATASVGRERRMSGIHHQSRSGCGGRHTNDCLKGLKNIVAKPECYRERSCSTATWFRPPAT